MSINEDQLWGNWAKTREIFSMPGDSSRSQWIGRGEREVVILDDGESKAARSRSLSKKSLA